MIKYLFIGSVEFSAHCLRSLLEMNTNIIDIMCPEKDSCRFNSDYFDIGIVAKKFRRKVHYFKKIKDEINHIESCEPDVIFVLGLSKIIPKEILDIPKIGCVGSHPSLLPKNRGRHPIIWAIANGLNESGITLFWMDEGVDSGDIWTQRKFKILTDDDASTLYKKVTDLTIDMLRKEIPQLEKGIIKRMPQDHSKANYWRRRTEKDGEIDWRMSSKRIHNLVRSLAKPYIGAHCLLDGIGIKIWKTRILEEAKESHSLEPGKVVGVRKDKIIVKTGDGLIELVKHELKKIPKRGDYL